MIEDAQFIPLSPNPSKFIEKLKLLVDIESDHAAERVLYLGRGTPDAVRHVERSDDAAADGGCRQGPGDRQIARSPGRA